MTTIIEKINEGIKESMRSRDSLRLDTLRMLKSKILAVDARCNLPDPEVIKLFKTYMGNLQEGVEQAIEVNRPEIADKLKSEIVIIQEFLPNALSVEETRRLVEKAIQQSGAKSKKDLGLVMKAIKQMSSEIDGKTAKDIADSLLV